MNYKYDGRDIIFETPCFYWNVSTGRENKDQKENKFVFVQKDKVVNWVNMCNVTAICNALECNGFIFPKGQYERPQDNLAHFMLNNNEIDAEYKRRFPALYNEWNKGVKNCYSPLEIHKLLELGVNKWFGADIEKFSTNTLISLLIKQIIDERSASVISGQFGNLGHIVSMVGVAYRESDYTAIIKANKPLESSMPYAVCYDDPWGKFDIKTLKYDIKASGDNNWMLFSDFIKIFKERNNFQYKWAHTFNKPVALEPIITSESLSRMVHTPDIPLMPFGKAVVSDR